jgi:hypothetical protein
VWQDYPLKRNLAIETRTDQKRNLGNSDESLGARIGSSLRYWWRMCWSPWSRCSELGWHPVFILRRSVAPLPISSDIIYHILQSLSNIGGQLNSLCSTIHKSFVLTLLVHSRYSINAFRLKTMSTAVKSTPLKKVQLKTYCLWRHISSRVANFHSKNDIGIWASSRVTWSIHLLA